MKTLAQTTQEIYSALYEGENVPDKIDVLEAERILKANKALEIEIVAEREDYLTSDREIIAAAIAITRRLKECERYV